MVSFEKRKLYIDGKPIFLLSGEVHYYRLQRGDWQHIIDEAKDMGLNCIASYVPWILHEEQEGEYDFEDNLDLGAFIDLCKDNGLYFFVRPGPFIMAEMKHEGIPYWIYAKHPTARPIGYEGKSAYGSTLDYLHPGYLEDCRRWYKKVLSIVRPRLYCNGGNIIGVQLDNEVGMLNWLTDVPVLNDMALDRFCEWVKEKYSAEELASRYPFALDASVYDKLRAPDESFSVPYTNDLNEYMRTYYARYLLKLAEFASEEGIADTPFFVNIHGTGDGRIYDFPLGVSQLYEAYNQGGFISGTDVYLGDPTIANFQDSYVCNLYTVASNKREQPLTSIEFECADGPYCSRNIGRTHPAAVSQRMIINMAQDARMINFYVFNGGTNYMLKHPYNDGNLRMAFTNEFHGYSAPVEPDGHHNYSFDLIRDTAQAIAALNPLVADYKQKTDNVVFGVIPDYFLNETIYPKSKNVAEIHENLRKNRCAHKIDGLVRALLNENINFTAVDLQTDALDGINNLVLLTALYTPADVQQKLVDFAAAGGTLILYGEIPMMDLEGNPCTILKDALKLSDPVEVSNDFPYYFLTVRDEAEDRTPDYTASSVQGFAKDETAILSVFTKDLMCGFNRPLGKGRVVAITANYPGDMEFYSRLFKQLDIKPSVKVDYYRYGHFASVSCGEDGGKLLYLCNLDAADKKTRLLLEDEVLFEQFEMFAKQALILPVNIKLPCATVVKSTAQINGVDENSITFRLSQSADEIILDTDRTVLPDVGYTATHEADGKVRICSNQHAKIDPILTVRFAEV